MIQQIGIRGDVKWLPLDFMTQRYFIASSVGSTLKMHGDRVTEEMALWVSTYCSSVSLQNIHAS